MYAYVKVHKRQAIQGLGDGRASSPSAECMRRTLLASAAATTATTLLAAVALLVPACGLSTVGLGTSDSGRDSTEAAGDDGSPLRDSAPPQDGPTPPSADGGAVEDGQPALGRDSAIADSGDAAERDRSSDAVPDVTGMVAPECKACLDTNCSSAYSSCLGDPACYDIVVCTDQCIGAGREAEECGLYCVETSESDAGRGQAEGLVACTQSSCYVPCMTVGGL